LIDFSSILIGRPLKVEETSIQRFKNRKSEKYHLSYPIGDNGGRPNVEAAIFL